MHVGMAPASLPMHLAMAPALFNMERCIVTFMARLPPLSLASQSTLAAKLHTTLSLLQLLRASLSGDVGPNDADGPDVIDLDTTPLPRACHPSTLPAHHAARTTYNLERHVLTFLANLPLMPPASQAALAAKVHDMLMLLQILKATHAASCLRLV
jgi:hypothetical protein